MSRRMIIYLISSCRGIVTTSTQDSTRFFQNPGSIGANFGQVKELDPENVLYIEDVTVPTDLSFLRFSIP